MHIVDLILDYPFPLSIILRKKHWIMVTKTFTWESGIRHFARRGVWVSVMSAYILITVSIMAIQNMKELFKLELRLMHAISTSGYHCLLELADATNDLTHERECPVEFI